MARGESGSIRGTFTQISSDKLHSIERRVRKKRSSGMFTSMDESEVFSNTICITLSLPQIYSKHIGDYINFVIFLCDS
jgi:hypothetical protein